MVGSGDKPMSPASGRTPGVAAGAIALSRDVRSIRRFFTYRDGKERGKRGAKN